MDQVEKGPALVVVTGGEPLLAGDSLVALAQAITATGRSLDIETNGTQAPPPALAPLVRHYVISPKLSIRVTPRSSGGCRRSCPPGRSSS